MMKTLMMKKLKTSFHFLFILFALRLLGGFMIYDPKFFSMSDDEESDEDFEEDEEEDFDEDWDDDEK